MFLFLIGPCLLIIAAGCLVLGLAAGSALGLFVRSFGIGCLAAVLITAVAVIGGTTYFFNGFKGPTATEKAYTLHGREVVQGSGELAGWLAGTGMLLLAAACLYRLATSRPASEAPEFDPREHDEPPAPRDVDGNNNCYLCGRRLTVAEIRTRVCKRCRA